MFVELCLSAVLSATILEYVRFLMVKYIEFIRLVKHICVYLLTIEQFILVFIRLIGEL